MDPLPHDKQPSETSTGAASKSRFRIEKLEERIAPKNCHYNPHGKMVGCGKYDPCSPDDGYWCY